MVARLTGKTAIVTGGSRGIGAAIVQYFLHEGAQVLVACRSEPKAHSEGLWGSRGVWCATDMSKPTDVEALFAKARERFNDKLDVLVNNAAVNVQGSIFDYDPADWDRVIDVDLTAAWYLIRITIGAMRDQGWGRIVNVSSVAAYNGGNGVEGPYSAAKAALNDVTRSVAIEGGPHGIRCNAVAPGLVQSRWVEAHPGRYESFIAATPLRRHAQPVDVANTVAFLCSDDSAHVTGEVINVSGGWLLTP